MEAFVCGGFENRHHRSCGWMKTLQDIRRQLATGKFEFSRHAFRRAVERNISEQEIREAAADSELIDNYPDDKYSPSAFLLGFTAGGRCTFRYRLPRRI